MTEVASYGRQIGWLTEIALALAKNKPSHEETLHGLTEASEEIEAYATLAACSNARRVVLFDPPGKLGKRVFRRS